MLLLLNNKAKIMTKGRKRKINNEIIKVKEPQICDNCKKTSKYICIYEDKIICKGCYSKIQSNNKHSDKTNHTSNPQLCIANKTGVYCNIYNKVVTTFQKFKSGKSVCIHCYNSMTEGKIKQLQTEEYNTDNTKKYENTIKIKFVQGGNP